MSHFLPITSFQNPKVKTVLKLREKRERDRTHCFLIEGYREITRAFEAQYEFLTFFYSSHHFLGNHEEELIKKVANKKTQIFSIKKEVFEKMSYRDRPDGLLVIAKQKTLKLKDFCWSVAIDQPPFFVIAQAIEKPGNLGSILRSCDGARVDALFVCDHCTDIYNPNVVRSSVGTLFSLPIIQAKSGETIDWLKQNRIPIIATTPQASLVYTQADLKGPLAIAVGTEQLGLSKEWMSQAEIKVSIPMRGVADSLNVASATTLLLYEVIRQRS